MKINNLIHFNHLKCLASASPGFGSIIRAPYTSKPLPKYSKSTSNFTRFLVERYDGWNALACSSLSSSECESLSLPELLNYADENELKSNLSTVKYAV